MMSSRQGQTACDDGCALLLVNCGCPIVLPLPALKVTRDPNARPGDKEALAERPMKTCIIYSQVCAVGGCGSMGGLLSVSGRQHPYKE